MSNAESSVVPKMVIQQLLLLLFMSAASFSVHLLSILLLHFVVFAYLRFLRFHSFDFLTYIFADSSLLVGLLCGSVPL